MLNANGTLTTYTWDGENRLATIQTASGTIILTYSVPPLPLGEGWGEGARGLRRVRQDGSGTVKYLWDGQVPLMETDGDGTTVARYTGASGSYGPIVSQRRSSTSRFYHPSVLGTVETLTAADASVTDTYIIDAWGAQHASTGSTTNPFRYIGALGYYTEPDLGLAYVRARWLRAATGSWLSVDPVEGEMRYGYPGDTPTWAIDPSGLKWPSLWCWFPWIGWTICLIKYGWPWEPGGAAAVYALPPGASEAATVADPHAAAGLAAAVAANRMEARMCDQNDAACGPGAEEDEGSRPKQVLRGAYSYGISE